MALWPPTELSTTEFLLRPIRLSDAERDYEAVMESKEFLREWEQTGWPDDNFTVDTNRDDVSRLVQRHQDGESFTYTILNPALDHCLGCVYIFPTSSRLFSKAQIFTLGALTWSDYEVAIYFWVRTSRIADKLDERLLEKLDLWLTQEWKIERRLLLTSETAHQQVLMLEGNGRKCQFAIKFANKPYKEMAYH